MDSRTLEILGGEALVRKRCPTLWRLQEGKEPDAAGEIDLLRAFDLTWYGKTLYTELVLQLQPYMKFSVPAAFTFSEVWDGAGETLLESGYSEVLLKCDGFMRRELRFEGEKVRGERGQPLVFSAEVVWMGKDGKLRRAHIDRPAYMDPRQNPIVTLQVFDPRGRDHKLTKIYYNYGGEPPTPADYWYKPGSSSAYVDWRLPFRGEAELSEEWELVSVCTHPPLESSLQIFCDVTGPLVYRRPLAERFQYDKNRLTWDFGEDWGDWLNCGFEGDAAYQARLFCELFLELRHREQKSSTIARLVISSPPKGFTPEEALGGDPSVTHVERIELWYAHYVDPNGQQGETGWWDFNVEAARKELCALVKELRGR